MDKIKVYNEAYRVKLENEMLKFENEYLKSIIDLSLVHGNIQKTKAYKDLIDIMNLLRKAPFSYICRKNSTFVLFEKRYYHEDGKPQFDKLLNHRAESDLIALLGKINKSPLSKLFLFSKKYKNLINEYL